LVNPFSKKKVIKKNLLSIMFKKYSKDPEFSDQRVNSSSFSSSLQQTQRKGLFSDYSPDENYTIIIFLSKRGTLRAPFACEVLKNIVLNSKFTGRLGIFFRGVTMVYDECPVDNRINQYAGSTGITIGGQSKFADPEDLEKADFIICLDQESMDFARLHRIRGYLYPFTFFRPAGVNGFIPDPYESCDDLDSHYREIISSIQLGCRRIVLSLLSTLSF
jgi:protein-tyrosine-phosphatase